MKKFAAVLLGAAMLFTLAACRKENVLKTEVVGEWIAVSNGTTVVFREDQTAEMTVKGKTQGYTWTYHSDTNSYSLDGIPTYTAKYGKEYDLEYLSISGVDFYRMDDYNTAITLMLSKRHEEIANLTSQMKKVECNTAYDLVDGVTVEFSNIAIVELSGVEVLQIDYSIINNRKDKVSDSASSALYGKYFLKDQVLATLDIGNIAWFSSMDAGEIITNSLVISLKEDPKPTIDAYGKVIGAYYFKMNGQEYFIDLSEWFA